MVIHPS